MKILAICYQYGTSTPGGIINKNVLDGLSLNHDVKIIAALTNTTNSDDVFTCSTTPNRPHRVFDTLGDLFEINIDDIAWEFRAKQKAKKIIKDWQPDVIYSRGQPLSPLNVGRYIAKKYDLPFMIHFSDPLPAPVEWKPKPAYRNKILSGIKPVLLHANKLSFVTRAMLNYQHDVSKINITDRSVVINNPISNIDDFPPPNNDKIVFLYIGTFYGNRKPDLLIDGFNEFSSVNSSCELHIVGNNQHLAHLNDHNIKILPYSTNPFQLMSDANILIDIDSDCKNEVFMSSKLLDYLSTNRVIVSITSNQSPASDVLSTLKNTAIISSHDLTNIIGAFEKAIKVIWTPDLFDERNEIQNYFSLQSIVKKTEDGLLSIVDK
jgi:glycosyltransferase involved in cell wall biosynthesis